MRKFWGLYLAGFMVVALGTLRYASARSASDHTTLSLKSFDSNGVESNQGTLQKICWQNAPVPAKLVYKVPGSRAQLVQGTTQATGCTDQFVDQTKQTQLALYTLYDAADHVHARLMTNAIVRSSLPNH